MVALLVLAACGEVVSDPDETDDVTDTDSDAVDPGETDAPVLPDYEALPANELLVRTSLDLRGIRPSLDELARVEADPAALDTLIEEFLASPRFGRRVREIYDDVFLTRDELPFVDLEFLRLRWSIKDLSRSIGEEPTRMLEHLANEGISYAEFVTGDWTMANEVTADIFPVEYPDGATGWLPSRYTDGRPAAGALAVNGLWWQHGSMLNNLNRGRANHFSRIFLCLDYLNAQIDFTGVSALDSEEALGDAIRTDPACAACHDTLDPLAAHFYGFWYFSRRKYDAWDIRSYHPERERVWTSLGGLPPSFRGEPTTGLADLGRRTAAEPGYSQCFAQRSWEGVLRRAPLPAERALIDDHDATFRAASLDIRALYRDIVHSDAYRNGAGEDGLKLVSPAVLSSQIEDLTGFWWAEDEWDLVRAPQVGFGPLAGAVDDLNRALPLLEPAATLALVHKRLAEAAATWVVDHDLAPDRVGEARLLSLVDGTESVATPEGAAAVRAQIVAVYERILTQRVAPEDPQIDALAALWRDVRAAAGTEPAREAWAAVITVLLRDPRLLVY